MKNGNSFAEMKRLENKPTIAIMQKIIKLTQPLHKSQKLNLAFVTVEFSMDFSESHLLARGGPS